MLSLFLSLKMVMQMDNVRNYPHQIVLNWRDEVWCWHFRKLPLYMTYSTTLARLSFFSLLYVTDIVLYSTSIFVYSQQMLFFKWSEYEPLCCITEWACHIKREFYYRLFSLNVAKLRSSSFFIYRAVSQAQTAQWACSLAHNSHLLTHVMRSAATEETVVRRKRSCCCQVCFSSFSIPFQCAPKADVLNVTSYRNVGISVDNATTL